MSKGFLLSILFHIVMVLLILLDLPFMNQKIEILESAGVEVMVETETDMPSPQTGSKKPVPQKAEPKVEPKPEPKEEPKIEPKEEPKPIEPDAMPKPEIKPEPKPEPKKEEPKPEPKKKDDFEDVLSAVKEIKKEKPKKKKDDFDSILDAVNHLKSDKPAGKKGKNGGKNGGDDKNDLSDDEIARIKSQIRGCVMNRFEIDVPMTIKIGEDGRIFSGKITGGRYGDPEFESASEEYLRAVNNPRCNDLSFLKNKYKELNLVFKGD